MSAYAYRAVSYTHLDVYKRQDTILLKSLKGSPVKGELTIDARMRMNDSEPFEWYRLVLKPVSYTHLRLHEVGIASNRGSECRGEYVPGPCTHRPSHHESCLLYTSDVYKRQPF